MPTTLDPSGTCPDPELITALVDGEIDLVPRDDVLSHLASCGDCRTLVDGERRAKNVVRALAEDTDDAPVPSAELLARLRAVPETAAPAAVPAPAPVSLDERRDRRARRTPAYLGAAASVAVFMVGGFAFLGSTAAERGPSTPGGTTAIVPAADRLTLEHAATTSQTSLGGPNIAPVSVEVPATDPTAGAR